MVYGETSVFKSSPNEHVMLIPGIGLSDAEKIASDIELLFKEEMLKDNFADASLNLRRVSYIDGIPSISSLFKWLNKSFFESNYTNVLKDEIEDWTDKFIERVISSFKGNLTLLQEIDSISLSDDISRLPNHRAAEMYLLQQTENYQSKQQGYSVLFIDGDNLKRYNQLSYQQGNKMIEGLSRIISNAIRQEDRVFRWLSGDEFVVILGNTDLEEAMQIAERVRYSVEQGTKDWQYPITISVGVANCPSDGISSDVIVSKAEEANTIAKKSGKNKVVYIAEESSK